MVVFIIVFSDFSLSAVEIIIEYNVSQNCTGNVLLALNPSTVTRGGSVTPSASGLTSCGDYVVYFRRDSCSGTTASQCAIPVGTTGCSGSSFSAPTTLGTYTYYACIDKNDDADFADTGESDPETLNVVSAIPSVGSLTISPAVVDLIEESKKKISVSATVSDADGASDIVSCRGYVWNSTTSSPLTPSNARYVNSSCPLSGCSGSSCTCNCTFNLMYYDINGTWRTNLTVNDTSAATGTNSGNFIVNPKLALSFKNLFGPVNSTNLPIQFQTISVGDVNRPSSSNPLKIINTGNVKINITLSGTDHIGSPDTSWVLKVENMTYNSSASGMSTLRQLTYSPIEFYPSGGIPVYPNSVSGIPELATFYIKNYLSIPLAWKAQTYAGTYIIEVEMI